VTQTLREARPRTDGAERTLDQPWLVPLSNVYPDADLQRVVADAVNSGWWSAGPRVAEFERRFADVCGGGTALAVANGTAALHLALLAVGCGPGDEVILPALNFVAAANVIGWVGAAPVFCDVHGEDDLTLDPADVEAAITSRSRAVVVMHYGGHPCDMERLLEISARHGLAVVEDAAHAPGATLNGRALGGMGDVGCFSFFANKNLPIGEGGMVITSDAEVADRMRLLRSHGMTTMSWDRHRGHANTYDVLAPGFNYRMDDIRAAIGIVHLERLAAWNSARGRIVDEYRAELHDFNGIQMPFRPRGNASPAHHLAVILLPPDISRDAVRTALASKRVQTSVHYPPTHRFSWYRSNAGSRSLPVTDALADRLLTLPLYPDMGHDAVRTVIDAVKSAVSNRPAVPTPPTRET
jgi:dTDP-4-amino-4,6-dideoxygalactose transaminase